MNGNGHLAKHNGNGHVTIASKVNENSNAVANTPHAPAARANGNRNATANASLTKGIAAALSAHRRWKERLSRAIETGTSEFQPAIVRMDNQCDFGKWLYSQNSDVQSTAQFQQIKELHAEFHREAAQILERALTGRKREAMEAMGFGRKFADTSAELFNQLMRWYQEARATASQTQTNTEKTSYEKLERVLAERAKALTKSNTQQTGASTQLVVFVLANEKYGIPIEYIAEVQPLRDLTPVPCTPNFVVGIINIRGSIYSVIDVRSLFAVAGAERTDTTKVILVRGGGMELGILADDVQGAASVLLSDIKAVLASHGAAKEEYIQGVTQDMITILNLDVLLKDERIIVREEIA